MVQAVVNVIGMIPAIRVQDLVAVNPWNVTEGVVPKEIVSLEVTPEEVNDIQGVTTTVGWLTAPMLAWATDTVYPLAGVAPEGSSPRTLCPTDQKAPLALGAGESNVSAVPPVGPGKPMATVVEGMNP
jgi:hypothetical protein